MAQHFSRLSQSHAEMVKCKTGSHMHEKETSYTATNSGSVMRTLFLSLSLNVFSNIFFSFSPRIRFCAHPAYLSVGIPNPRPIFAPFWKYVNTTRSPISVTLRDSDAQQPCWCYRDTREIDTSKWHLWASSISVLCTLLSGIHAKWRPLSWSPE